MPARITPSTTNPITGEISKDNVDRMINDYQDHVVLNYDSGSRKVYKHFYFEIDLDRIHDMMKKTKDADNKLFRVHLSLNLPDQHTCAAKNPDDIGDFLSILVCCVDKKEGPQQPLLEPGDFILTEGFRDYKLEQNFRKECCVQGTPPPPK